MTIDDQLRQPFQALSCSEQQQIPFHIVLVDINKAAKGKIDCVELPLNDDLQYVALSYRWGELQEKMIDTNVGYIATVTSFRLEDFCQLCRLITMDQDLHGLEYVWVDAICVDQTNHERRKATIHQMTNIYEHAHTILAVPDLYLQYLKNAHSEHRRDIHRAAQFRKDIYYLLHRKLDPLMKLEQERLDFYGVPKDPELRQLLTQWTDYFRIGLTDYREHGFHYNPEEILDHIYESVTTTTMDDDSIQQTKNDYIPKEIQQLHDCDQGQDCPFIHFTTEKPKSPNDTTRSGRNRLWKQQILDRSALLHRTLNFLSDIVVDWSSRAWVLSEFTIAKKKNNMKYWFIQLMPSTMKDIQHIFTMDDDEPFSFFKFNFNDPAHATIQSKIIKQPTRNNKITASDPVYLNFHQTMIRQLKEQTFLELMLKSKASRNEDRFHSVLPLSKYKHKLISKESVAHWNISTILTVKLQLYEWMDIKDKLNLVFLSSHTNKRDLALILPTFATTCIFWSKCADFFTVDETRFNFDLADESTIVLDHHNDLYSLQLKPFEYYVHVPGQHKDSCKAYLLERTSLCKRIDLDHDGLDVVAIPNILARNHSMKISWIHLIGSFTKNKWVFDRCTLTCLPTDTEDWVHHQHHTNNITVFNIY